MSPDWFMAISLGIIAIAHVIALFFLIRFFVGVRKSAAEISGTLNKIDRNITPLAIQSNRTLEAVELASLHVTNILRKVDEPISYITSVTQKTESLLNPQIIAAIFGVLKGIKMFRKVFAKSEDQAK